MAVTELYTTREMHITKEGTTVTRYFTCSNVDFNNGGDGTITLPVVGDIWSDSRPDLRVTDVRVYWLSNENCRYEATYSTRGMASREQRVNKVSSMRDVFDFNTQTVDVTAGGFKDTDGNPQIWADLWAAEGGNNTVENAPPLVRYVPNIVWTSIIYQENWIWNDVKDAFGKVNNTDFLKQYYIEHGQKVDVTGDDTGKWLFAGFNATEVSEGVYELTMMFLYDDDGWNTPYGISSSTKMYGTANFRTALPWPTDKDDYVDDGLR